MDARAEAAQPGISERVIGHRHSAYGLKPRRCLLHRLSLLAAYHLVTKFVPAVTGAILHADVAHTVLPGAREQIQLLAEAGDRPAMWSAGHPEHQLRKFGKTGLRDIVAMEGIEPPVEVTSQHGEPIDIETAVAPHKATAETFEGFVRLPAKIR